MTNDEFQRNDEVKITNYDHSPFENSQNEENLFWGEDSQPEHSILREEPNQNRVFDLEERTSRFGEEIIKFAKKIPQGPVNNRLISQLVGVGTSVGANSCEADNGVSRKDFKNGIGTCRKEARETKFFLRMVATAEPNLKDEARKLWHEARVLHLIFCAIWRK
jgi:four helix bundle protein